VCQPVQDKMSDEAVLQELKHETLFDIHNTENLFFQRMILYFESIGVTGFKYPNFTEGPGDMSYIILRQNNVLCTDKELPEHPKYLICIDTYLLFLYVLANGSNQA
jgi:hypothetical protein